MPDVMLHCVDCEQPFTFTLQEQMFFASRNIVNPPERCKPCRERRKQERQDNSSSDQILICVDCGQRFVFTGGEQKFYQQKGMSAPTRCKPCREKRKQERGNQSSGSTQPGQLRQMHVIICASCGRESKVPFEPKPGRPVYCRDCYQPRSNAR